MEDFTDPRGNRLDKFTVRRGWLILFAILAIFIALTKVFPSRPASHTATQQLTDVDKPSH